MTSIADYKTLEVLAERHPRYLRLKTLASVETLTGQEPMLWFELSDRDARVEGADNRPVLAFFAGVHGIEAIGVKILLAFIDHVVEQTLWNSQMVDLLKRVRIVGIPIVNPWGYVAESRCNGQGVDLMRNAPVESAVSVPFVGGHRLSPSLPYYRGEGGFERENLELIAFVERELWKAPFALALDLHSGFGMEDYLWTPYAKEKGFPPLWEHYARVSALLDKTLRNHVYRFEPQSRQYCTGGDLWDYLFDKALEDRSAGIFLPLTLEVGSWAWLRKSPSKVLSLRNFFNPAHTHRERRVLRRHLPLLNMLLHVVADYDRVLGVPTVRREAA